MLWARSWEGNPFLNADGRRTDGREVDGKEGKGRRGNCLVCKINEKRYLNKKIKSYLYLR